jgi:hypothetical protein
VIKVAEGGKELASHSVINAVEAIGDLISEIRSAAASHGLATTGIAILGGLGSLLAAMPAQARAKNEMCRHIGPDILSRRRLSPAWPPRPRR